MTPRKPRPPAKRAAPAAPAKAKPSARAQAKAPGRSTMGPRAASKPGSPAERRLARRCEALTAQVAALRSALDAFERGRSELCAALSHDLRNPLTVVVWSAQLLGRRIPPEDTARRPLDGVTRAAEEMNQMLYELSDLARIPDRRLDQALELAEGTVGALVDHAAAASRALAQSKDVTLTVEVPTSIGSLSCDRDRVTRVLGALLSGAVRRSPKGGAVTLRAERGVEHGSEVVRIAVQDRGPDIPAEHHEALFELPTPPAPGAPRSPRPGGSAIALYVARGVIEAHGGRLWMEHEVGHGARFMVVLPVS